VYPLMSDQVTNSCRSGELVVAAPRVREKKRKGGGGEKVLGHKNNLTRSRVQ